MLSLLGLALIVCSLGSAVHFTRSTCFRCGAKLDAQRACWVCEREARAVRMGMRPWRRMR